MCDCVCACCVRVLWLCICLCGCVGGWVGVMWIYVRTKYRNGICWIILLSNVSGGGGDGG